MSRTQMNAEALRINKENFFGKLDRNYCESCGVSFGLSFAHRQKRRHYRTVKELTDYNEVIVLCLREHQIIEKSQGKTRELFDRLRPRRDK